MGNMNNTKSDRNYFFRVSNGLNWYPIGEHLNDEEAKAAVINMKPRIVSGRVTGVYVAGRLAVMIGDFFFPVMDLEGGSWITCKPRKSYDQNRKVTK